MKGSSPAKYAGYLRNRIRSSRRAFIVYSVLRILVICCMVRQFWIRNWEGVAICALSLILFLIPSFMEDHFKIEIPPFFEASIYLFIFAAEILGEVDNFYINIPGWDTVLHTINGFLCAAVGFSMIDLMNRHTKRMNLSPFYLAMVAFCFSMTVGVCWEFIEFAGDQFFGQDMQKDFIVKNSKQYQNGINWTFEVSKSQCLSRFFDLSYYSHSMVAQGLGVRSKRTRLTPFTSWVMRAVMCCKSEKGTSSTVAVIASVVFTARRMTG